MQNKNCIHIGEKSKYTDAHYCTIAKSYPDYMCEDIKNCYYKQLKAKEKEVKYLDNYITKIFETLGVPKPLIRTQEEINTIVEQRLKEVNNAN